MPGPYQTPGPATPKTRPTKGTGATSNAVPPSSTFTFEQRLPTSTSGQPVAKKPTLPGAQLENRTFTSPSKVKRVGIERLERVFLLPRKAIITNSISEDSDSDASSSASSSSGRPPRPKGASTTLAHSPSSNPKMVHQVPTVKTEPRVPPVTQQQSKETKQLNYHLQLLSQGTASQESHEIQTTPVFTAPVLKYFKGQDLFSQYGFIAGQSDLLSSTKLLTADPRIFFNISAPSSAFICGSQGSGKSHTLSCLLENCLMKSDVSVLDSPLAGLLFHYDSFTSDEKGTPCEAAYLSSNSNIKVRVLCSPTNLRTIERTYAQLPNVTVESLRINQTDLNTRRMLDLMAVSTENGPMPLYLHSINRILRELRMVQQEINGTFNYMEFKRRVEEEDLTPMQRGPLNQRLDTLESFMPKSQVPVPALPGQGKKTGPDRMFAAPTAPQWESKNEKSSGTDWSIKAGTLTILDLSCPCVTAESACALFNMCLSLFLEQKTDVGRVIALDEAHKYMLSTSESASLTNTLLSSIRLQRHLGTRVFISTQEPTISPKLLDLCSITIVHRFTSPEWLQCLRQHLAALDADQYETGDGEGNKVSGKENAKNTFDEIVRLRVGEALMFAPSAVVSVSPNGVMTKLGTKYIKIKIRGRITDDGGKSVLAQAHSPEPKPKPVQVAHHNGFFGIDTSAVPVFTSTAASTSLSKNLQDLNIQEKEDGYGNGYETSLTSTSQSRPPTSLSTKNLAPQSNTQPQTKTNKIFAKKAETNGAVSFDHTSTATWRSRRTRQREALAVYGNGDKSNNMREAAKRDEEATAAAFKKKERHYLPGEGGLKHEVRALAAEEGGWRARKIGEESGTGNSNGGAVDRAQLQAEKRARKKERKWLRKLEESAEN